MKKRVLITTVFLSIFNLTGCYTQVNVKPEPVNSSQNQSNTNNGAIDYTPPGSTDMKQVYLNTPYDIKIDNTVEVKESRLRIKLISIEDSRCASDVQCVQAGNVKAKFNITLFDTNLADGELDSKTGIYKFGEYSLKMNKVLPETKKSTDNLKPSDYTLSMIISKN